MRPFASLFSSLSISKTWYLIDEEPEFRISIFMGAGIA
jgi:hypothetical protein